MPDRYTLVSSSAWPSASGVRVSGTRRVVSLVVSVVMVLALLVAGVVTLALVPVTASAAPTPLIAYVTNQNGGTVTPVDLATSTPGTPIPVGNGPLGVAITPDCTTAYVTNYSNLSNSVTPIDLATNTPGTPIPVGTTPFGIAITPDGTTAYVANQGSNTVTPINLATHTPGTPIPVSNDPIGVAITPDGKTIYVTHNNSSGTVTPITVDTNTPGTPIIVGNRPAGIAVTPDGTTAYVTNAGSNTVTPIELATHTPGTPIPVGSQPLGVVVTPSGETAYVTNYDSNTVTPIELATRTPGTPIAVGLNPVEIAIPPVSPATTAMQLLINPQSPALAGTLETLRARVTPTTAAGRVQFTDGTTPVGDPVPVTNGTASTTTTLRVGIHSLTAVFTPTNAGLFTGSTSPAVSYVVYATATTTTLSVAPNHAFSAIPVVLTARVTPLHTAGTIRFTAGTTPWVSPSPSSPASPSSPPQP